MNDRFGGFADSSEPWHSRTSVIASRRQVLAGLAALTACAPSSRPEGDVFAAGQPAAILVLALAPERLLGWPRRPGRAAFDLLPASADRPQLGALASGGAPADLEAVAALAPRLILDYGDVEVDYEAIAKRVERRLGRPYHLIDGALRRTPEALVEAGALLDVPDRAARLSDAAARILAQWAASARTGPGFYYARGGDGLETGFAGSLATEVLEGAGWTNLAAGGRDIGRVSREQVVRWDPEVVVTLDRGFARAAVSDPLWAERVGGGRRRLLLLPDVPFGWIDRPPSINRLLGCAWLATGGGTRPGPDVTAAAFSELFYGRRLSTDEARGLVPRWLA